MPELIDAFVDRARRRPSRTTSTHCPTRCCSLGVRVAAKRPRELQHVLEGAVLLSGGVIPEHLPPVIPKPDAQEGAKASGRSLDETIEDIERQMILGALSRAGRVQVHLARLPGITAQSRWYRIKKSGIQARVAGTLPPLLAAPGAWAPCSPPPLCPSN